MGVPCHAQERGPRSPQGHVMALDKEKKKKILYNFPAIDKYIQPVYNPQTAFIYNI
jgi:hypothetical protein